MQRAADHRRLSRRNLIAGSLAGSLFGSAWAVAFREATSQDDTPTATVARDADSLVLLLEYEGRRILALDSSDPVVLKELTELATGFMKQRIDLLLATGDALGALPTTFRERWRIQEVLGLPDDPRSPATARAFDIGDLTLLTDRISGQGWRSNAEPGRSSWYASATYHGARLLLTDALDGAEHIPARPGADLTCVVTNDPEATIERMPKGVSIVAAPAECELFASEITENVTTLVPLHRDFPATVRLDEGGIVLPPAT